MTTSQIPIAEVRRKVAYHGTPFTPAAAFEAVMPGRACCIPYNDPRDLERAERICPDDIMYDNGEFHFWKKARKAGLEWSDEPRDYGGFYRWLEPRLFSGRRWAVIPDRPGAPSQINDGLLNTNPFGVERMAPLWHMNGSVERLGRLCEIYRRVCFGWVGEFDPATGDIREDEKDVGCDAYRRKMDEVQTLFGNSWHNIHMMRGLAVLHDYPIKSADATSLTQNGHRHDWRDNQDSLLPARHSGKWAGRKYYADRLEGIEDGDPNRRRRIFLRGSSRRARQDAWSHMGGDGLFPGWS